MINNSYQPQCRNEPKPLYLPIPLYACVQRDTLDQYIQGGETTSSTVIAIVY